MSWEILGKNKRGKLHSGGQARLPARLLCNETAISTWKGNTWERLCISAAHGTDRKKKHAWVTYVFSFAFARSNRKMRGPLNAYVTYVFFFFFFCFALVTLTENVTCRWSTSLSTYVFFLGLFLIELAKCNDFNVTQVTYVFCFFFLHWSKPK